MIKLRKIDYLFADLTGDWGKIVDAFKRSAPKTIVVDDDIIDRLYNSIMFGDMDALFLSDDDVVAVIITEIREDYILCKRDLLVYAGAAFRKLSSDDWMQCVGQTVEFARAHKCNNVTAYTVVPKIVSVAASLGLSTEERYISLPVGV